MFGRIGQGQGSAPRTTEDGPPINAAGAPQLLNVSDEVPGSILMEAEEGLGETAAALIKHNNSPPLEIEVAEDLLARRARSTGPAMQYNDRLSCW